MAVLAVAIGAVLLAMPAVAAADFTVDTTADGHDATPGGPCEATDGQSDCTLRAAIESANLNGPGVDVITLPPGVYKLTLGKLQVGSEIVIDGAGSAANTVVEHDGVNSSFPDRVFEVLSGSGNNLELRDVTVTGGEVADNGAGIASSRALTLRRSVVSGNKALGGYDGGGIAILNGATSTMIIDSTIGGSTPADGNKVEGTGSSGDGQLGGGIYQQSLTDLLTIQNSTISDNSATADSGTGSAQGGGIFSQGPLKIEDSTIDSNTADATADAGSGHVEGGGIMNQGNNGGELIINRSTVSGNEASTSAPGGTADKGGIANFDNGTITDSRITDNTAPGTIGAGIWTGGGTAKTTTVRSSTVDGNHGGGVFITSDFELENSTVSGNAGGVGVQSNGVPIDVTVRASTIADNVTGLFAGDMSTVHASGSIVDGNTTRDCDLAGTGAFDFQGDSIASDNTCSSPPSFIEHPVTDALLGPLQANGGPTPTRAIPANSPAIDAYDGCAADGVTEDQRGVSRPQAGGCDIGAYERQPATSPPPPPGGGSNPAAPELTLDAKGKQKAKKLQVEVGCGAVACDVDLSGKSKVLKSKAGASAAKSKKFALVAQTVSVGAGATEKVSLKHKRNAKTVKKIAKLIKSGGSKAKKRSKAIVDATATSAGGTDTGRVTIRLKG